jgi:hypothetical protein
MNRSQNTCQNTSLADAADGDGQADIAEQKTTAESPGKKVIPKPVWRLGPNAEQGPQSPDEIQEQIAALSAGSNDNVTTNVSIHPGSIDGSNRSSMAENGDHQATNNDERKMDERKTQNDESKTQNDVTTKTEKNSTSTNSATPQKRPASMPSSVRPRAEDLTTYSILFGPPPTRQSALQTLNLEHNEIGPVGARRIAQMLVIYSGQRDRPSMII